MEYKKKLFTIEDSAYQRLIFFIRGEGFDAIISA